MLLITFLLSLEEVSIFTIDLCYVHMTLHPQFILLILLTGGHVLLETKHVLETLLDRLDWDGKVKVATTLFRLSRLKCIVQSNHTPQVLRVVSLLTVFHLISTPKILAIFILIP